MSQAVPKFIIKANLLLISGLVVWGGLASYKNNQLSEKIEQLSQQASGTGVAQPVAPGAPTAAVVNSPACDNTPQAVAAAATKTAPPAAKSSAQDTLDNIELLNIMSAVDKKYDRLLTGLNLGRAEKERLEKLLLDRERILNTATSSYYSDDVDTLLSVEQHNELLDQLDAEVAGLLGQDDYENYELFKESGLEQYQLSQYEQLLEGEASLTETQASELLVTKLKHKKEFMEAVSLAQQVAESGDVSAASYSVQQAVERYRQSYLSDVEPLLSSSQYQALSDFEVNEFEDIHDSLVAGFEQ